ncbi:DUF262 domain-containing HNH endonuclease family protein [Mollicutes bacterium LVI A0039]|nr:DUF262 domain-containing HNH endonuclease family protein [Mollicutes bacterium LVI A0039]
MRLNKIRNLGTNINKVIDEFYSEERNEFIYDKTMSESSYNLRIEIMLLLGMVKPTINSSFSAKAHFTRDVFLKVDIERDQISKAFCKVLRSKEVFTGQKESLFNLCVANIVYDHNEDVIREDMSKELSLIVENIDLEVVKQWFIPELYNVETIIEMKKFVGMLDKFQKNRMHKEYDKYLSWDGIPKDVVCPIPENKIEASVYNIHQLIADIGRSEYHIPIYQRNYVWSTESIDKLINDIIEYDYVNLNNITFHSSKSLAGNKYEIIDGQQRLTTLFLLLVALHRYLNNFFSEYDEERDINNKELLSINIYIQTNVYNQNDKIETNFSRIEGNDDYSAFKAILTSSECSADLRNTTVYENYNRMYERLEGMNVSELTHFSKKFMNNVMFILTVDAVSDEFILFENLNTTSIPLSTLDLIKSYMLSLLRSDLSNWESKFQNDFDQKITKVIYNEKNKIDIDNFIRVYIRSKNYKLDKTKSLLEQYKSLHNVKKASLSYEEVKNLLDELSLKLKLYNYLSGKVFKINLPELEGLKIEDFIDTIGIRDIYVPLMMFLSEKYISKELSSNEIRELLFEIETFEVIFKICSYRGQSLSDTMDSVLHKLAHDNNYNPSHLKEIMLEQNAMKYTLAINRASFKKIFNDFNFKTQISKIVLTRITNYLKNNKKISMNKNDEIRRIEGGTIEHIMPVDGKHWIKAKVVKEAEHQLLVNKIGNHLILEKSLNQTAKNFLFERKIEEIKKQTHMEDDLTYRKGQDGLGFEIKDLDDFNGKTINERQEFLANLAVEIWRK